MERKGRSAWQDTAKALERDHVAQEALVKKLQRETSCWPYAIFLIEWTLVTQPYG